MLLTTVTNTNDSATPSVQCNMFYHTVCEWNQNISARFSIRQISQNEASQTRFTLM